MKALGRGIRGAMMPVSEVRQRIGRCVSRIYLTEASASIAAASMVTRLPRSPSLLQVEGSPAT